MLTLYDNYIITDIETDGLLDTVSKFWCGCIYDSKDDSYTSFTNLDEYVDKLEYYAKNQYNIVFHNGICFDVPCLKILMGRDFSFDPRKVVLDTLVLARLIYGNIKDIDIGLMKSGKLPKSLFGSHSLKAYGYRLGELKGTYGEQKDAWDHFSNEMLTYNRQDVVVTKKLYNKLCAKKYPLKAIDLEHQIAWVMAKQERNGFVFDMDKAFELSIMLSDRKAQLKKELEELYGSWSVYKGDKIYKRDNVKRGIKAGVSYPQYEEVTFNPSSGAHRAKVLMDRGWKPTEFTPTGSPKTDEEALKTAVGIEGVDKILEYLLIDKRLGQLSTGSMAWLMMVNKDDDGYYRIHGRVNPNGAVTGRATHSYPNVAQVPSGHSEYGRECRSLFGVPEGWCEAGIDVSGLELRCFAEFLWDYDGGEYAHTVLNGDIHTANQKAAGLPTRDNAKTFVYGFLYGAGDAKIGQIVGGSSADGKRLKEKFFRAVPAIKKLRETLEDTLATSSEWVGNTQRVHWRKRKSADGSIDYTHCIVGLDGRPVYVRSIHSALNTVLQSAGALICKAWVVESERLLRETYSLSHGWDGDFALMAWVHDEIQVACRNKEVAEIVLKATKEAMTNVQHMFGFRTQLDVEGKIGANWYECH